MTRKEASVRRARLKSISLDSEGARLCTDSSLPVEELIERTLPQPSLHDAEDTPPFYSPMCGGGNDTPSKHKKCSKNIHRLVLDMSIEDNTIYPSYETDVQANLSTPKTPTLTQIRQKAFSLDSDQDQSISAAANELNQSALNAVHGSYLPKTKPHLKPNFLCVESNASASVPTTPKRHPIGKCALTKVIHGGTKCGKTITMVQKSDYDASTSAGGAAFFPINRKVGEKRCADKTTITAEEIDESSAYNNYEDACDVEAEHMGRFGTSVDDVDSDVISGSANSLISQYGASGVNCPANSNAQRSHTGFRSNLTAIGLSLSNYSLSNFQGSHSSLTRSNINLFGTSTTSAATSSLHMSQKSHSMFGYGSASSTKGNMFFSSSMQQQEQQQQQSLRLQSTTKANLQR